MSNGTEGLPGPAIDTGPEPTPRRAILPRWVKAMTATATVIAVGSLLFAAVLYTRSGSALTTANTAIRSAQLQALQSCVRNNIDAAVRIGRSQIGTPGIPAAENAKRRLVALHLYPLLDCKQSQIRRRSIQLVPAEREKYLVVVNDLARAPIVNMGRVVGSRPSILQGVKSLKQAGTTPPRP